MSEFQTGQKGRVFGAIALAASVALTACSADPRAHVAGSTPSATATPDASREAEATEEGAQMDIQLTVGDSVLPATLADSAATRDFIAMLPLTLTLRDYNGTEKISDLPSRLTTSGSPSGVDPAVGDITYFAPWGNLAIFYKDFGYSDGLIRLGTLDRGTEVLAAQRGEFTVTIERAQ